MSNILFVRNDGVFAVGHIDETGGVAMTQDGTKRRERLDARRRCRMSWIVRRV